MFFLARICNYQIQIWQQLVFYLCIDSILVDIQPGFVHYHVGEGKATWAELFKKMEEAKVVAEVESYYITSTNLDQVFFNFTRGQVVFDGNAK